MGGRWPFTIDYLVVGGDVQRVDLSDDDIAAIIDELALLRVDGIDCKAIVYLTIESADRVSVSTGIERGPMRGRGDEVVFEREHGRWDPVWFGTWVMVGEAPSRSP